MPSRILREGILTSERVAGLSWQAEVLYRRLMSVVDDYGRYFGRPMAIRAACFPLQLDRVKDVDVERWIAETVEHRLVRLYQANETAFLELLDFRQQVRARKSKFPDPAEGTEMQPSNEPAAQGGNAAESRAKRAQAIEILGFLNEKTGRQYQTAKANIDLIVARLNDGASLGDCRAVIAKKSREWLPDEKMAQYLRPATLFNRTKFAQYQGELGTPDGD